MPPNDGPLTQSASPRVQLAIISPCSQCKNQRDTEVDGKPACPRRSLARMAKDYADQGMDLPPSFAPALLKGTEGTNQESTETLRNPVYSDDSHHVLVWAAHLQDNMGRYDADGNLISRPLPDPSFDTDYIQCNGLPYVVQESEAGYFQTGAYKEWDTIEAIGMSTFQLDPTNDQDPDPLKLEGTARKVSLAYGFQRKHVDKDLAPRGT